MTIGIRTFTTAPECRAKAASLRTISQYALNPVSKERLLGLALDWDNKASKEEDRA